jgi:DNA anti-recombination protein RmuC
MVRRRDLAEQMSELKGLHGKNTTVIRQMRLRIEQEQTEFGSSGVRIHAVRSVHVKLLREVFKLLGTPSLKVELSELNNALRQPGIKFGIKKAYGQTFGRLREIIRQVQALSDEIHAMLGATFQQLNTEFGFSLQVPKITEMARYTQDLDSVERGHTQYLAVGNAIKLAQPEFADRLVRALATRVRSIFETVQTDVEMWNKSAMAQLDVQLRERRRNFERRVEAIERIQQAAGGLDERIDEIHLQEDSLSQLDTRLQELVATFVSEPIPISSAPRQQKSTE